MSRIKIYKHKIFVARKNNRYLITQCGVLFVKEGSLTYKTKRSDEVKTLSPGEFTIYHSDQTRELESHAYNGRFSAEIITFEPSLFRQICDNLPDSTGALTTNAASHPLEAEEKTSLSSDDKVTTEILKLLIDAKENETLTEISLELLAQALIIEMATAIPSFIPLIKSACNQSTAEKVIGFIEINIENDVTLDSTAKFLGMSIATLKRRLAAENLSFSQMLKIKRVNYAATKLRLTNKSIAQIALESGFKSAAHFSTAFKSIQNMTPKDFRQHVKSK